jgi:hypothetical protein
MTSRLRSSVLAVSALAFFAVPAAAHISLEKGGTHKSRYGDAELKNGPCGRDKGTRGTNVYTYEPGQEITVTFNEFVPHPSYYRFAFDNDGDNDFVTPKSIKPIDPSRKCPSSQADQCGQSDFYNSPTVLPNMDNLDPHLSGQAKNWTYKVKLPDVECTNCTLQIIQVMEDDAFHGPYTPGPGFPGDTLYVDDVYYQCIDLILKKGGGTNPGNGGTAGSGGAPASGGAPSGGTPGDSGGVAGVGNAPGASGGGAGVPANGGTSAGTGGAPTTGNGGVPSTTGNGGAPPAGTGSVPAASGASTGTGGATPGEPTEPSDEEGGCSLSARRLDSSSAGWLAVAFVAGALVVRRRRSLN